MEIAPDIVASGVSLQCHNRLPKNRDNPKAKCVEQQHGFLHFKVSFFSYQEFGRIQVSLFGLVSVF